MCDHVLYVRIYRKQSLKPSYSFAENENKTARFKLVRKKPSVILMKKKKKKSYVSQDRTVTKHLRKTSQGRREFAGPRLEETICHGRYGIAVGATQGSSS